MKTSIGIRVTPSIIYFTVVSLKGEGIEFEAIDKIVNPKALETPEKLKYIRNTLSDIIHEFKVTNACIRISETSAKSLSIDRIYIEGVIQELFASSTIEQYFIGQISNISSRLKIKREDFKVYSQGEKDFEGIEEWKQFKLEERESIMSAISSLGIK
ncbi:hypothetical protein HQR03_13655 [Psychrobacter okhotskensis]|uniref:hypothetical protein n=1 Tax=Psychrobacter okhotskensis TaxID=212403 RepID=UPI001565D867|nr:hypothetical protein [Psychrobacter okhotskensis]NRD71576.1 hypothetical protein [Psychrobacter okhotskensis]